MEKDWRGDIVFSDSVAIFRGHVGPNEAHAHWASQLTIALDGSVEFEAAGSGRLRSKAVYLPSNVEHRLFSGFVCSIYVDPLAGSKLEKLGDSSEAGWAALAKGQLPRPLRTLSASTDLESLLDADVLQVTGPSAVPDERFPDVVRAIERHLREGVSPGRDTLAERVGLSPSRFSHWFVEQSGVPLRSYKKWLKLRMAMEALLDGERPIHAAMQAGFSDQAHMSRAFSESFGLTYMDALHAWQRAQRG